MRPWTFPAAEMLSMTAAPPLFAPVTSPSAIPGVDLSQPRSGTQHFKMFVAVEGREGPMGTYAVTVHPASRPTGQLLVVQVTAAGWLPTVIAAVARLA